MHVWCAGGDSTAFPYARVSLVLAAGSCLAEEGAAAQSITLQQGTLALGQAAESGDIRAVHYALHAGTLLAVKEAQVQKWPMLILSPHAAMQCLFMCEVRNDFIPQ